VTFSVHILERGLAVEAIALRVESQAANVLPVNKPGE